MVYLLDKINLELFEIEKEKYYYFTLFETVEERVKDWIRNERCRSIFSRQEIINLFELKQKVQVVQTKKIILKPFDKVIIWTASGKYFVLELIKDIYENKKTV